MAHQPRVVGRRSRTTITVALVFTLAIPLTVATASGSSATGVQPGPPTRAEPSAAEVAAQRAAIEARLEVLTDEALDLLVRVEFPMVGEPEPTDEERTQARAVRTALRSRFGLLAPLPDDEPRRVIAEAFLRLSPDQSAAFDADMRRFDEETSPAYIRELRQARRTLDDLAVASMRLELDGARPMSAPEASAVNARLRDRITRLGIRHAELRAGRITAHAELLVPGQLEAFGLLAEAVRQEHLQRLLRWDLAGASFDAVRELAEFLDESGRIASTDAFAPLRRQLREALPARGAAILRTIRSAVEMIEASAAYMDLIGSGAEGITVDHPVVQRRTRTMERHVDAAARLVEINESLVAVIEAELGDELGRTFRRRFYAATTPWVDDIWPREWDAARAAVESVDPAQLSAGIIDRTAIADRRVAGAIVELRDAFREWQTAFRRQRSYQPADLPAMHQRFADRYLESQRAIEAAIASVHEVVAFEAEERPALGPLRDRLDAQRAISTAARAQAEELAEAGAIPWCRGLIIGSYRSEFAGWMRSR